MTDPNDRTPPTDTSDADELDDGRTRDNEPGDGRTRDNEPGDGRTREHEPGDGRTREHESDQQRAREIYEEVGAENPDPITRREAIEGELEDEGLSEAGGTIGEHNE